MTIALGQNSYGKSRVRLVQVTEKGGQRHLKDISVDIQLAGDFERAHTLATTAMFCRPTP